MWLLQGKVQAVGDRGGVLRLLSTCRGRQGKAGEGRGTGRGGHCRKCGGDWVEEKRVMSAAGACKRPRLDPGGRSPLVTRQVVTHS